MASKDKQLRNRLIRDAILIVVIVLILLAGALLLSDSDDDIQSDLQQRQNDNSKIAAERTGTEQQLSSQLEVSTYYETYVKNHNIDFVLNRESATLLLAAEREKNHLVDLSVTIAPISDMKGAGFALKTGVMVKSEISLSFGALTDNSVYGFIESLQRDLPGVVLITDIKITRTAELTREVLLALGQHKIIPLVKGELTFTWICIRPKTEEELGNGTKHGK